ncbi:hypothetical protein DCS_00350 [Drechmeria coniospora]|uniref:Uncharacterized protein n=1 Tax=Drechmeria coniospora TaxID=98403 RepID=A0A151GQ57_DRECN|nr:hypothetical protein DCS_00350 [Drechmeria coniospora]KYK59220.1 hypothetical protein DCS_00350 [Drechmeria coniospora]
MTVAVADHGHPPVGRRPSDAAPTANAASAAYRRPASCFRSRWATTRRGCRPDLGLAPRRPSQSARTKKQNKSWVAFELDPGSHPRMPAFHPSRERLFRRLGQIMPGNNTTRTKERMAESTRRCGAAVIGIADIAIQVQGQGT